MPDITDFYQLDFTGAELNRAAHKLLDGNGIENGDLAKLPAKTVLGNDTSGQGNAMALTVGQLKALLDIAADITSHNDNKSAHNNGIAGNANTATKLKSHVNIGNASFDGSASISFSDIGVEAAPPHNYLYDGANLKTVFGTAEAMHNAVSAGDYSKIRVGDYWPITLTGTVRDYATTTDKALNNAVLNLEVGAIVPYWQYGDSGELSGKKNHILFVSRDLLPWTLQFRSADTTWYNPDAQNPWLGSALYETLNNATNGVLALLLKSELGAYVYAGATGKGMRWLGETKAAGAASATTWAWYDRGRLFLPSEREVWGADVWSEHNWGAGAGLQWPIFAGSRRHVIKGLGNVGSRYTWWCESSNGGSASTVCNVTATGAASYAAAANPWIGAPVCFLFV